ncbi:MAG: hypothetical protein JWM41_1073 [Gemmatimonadetes bacterium]|nr:hypothetical protein [Gemmatimonadota bacterium]
MRTPRRWKAAALISSTTLLAALACSERPSPVAPDSAVTLPSNLLRACKAAPSDSPLRSTRFHAKASGRYTVTIGESIGFDLAGRAQLPLLALYGQVSSDGSHYSAPSNCTGADSVWVAFRELSGVLDTGVAVMDVTRPAIVAPKTAVVVTGGEKTIGVLAPRPTNRTAWTSPRIIGFLGATRGSAHAVSDTLVDYVAPSNTSGADSVRVVVEADYASIVIRDTTVLYVTLIPRVIAPSYSVASIGSTDPTVTLDARGLSSDGRVAGTSTLTNGDTHAFAWTNGRYTDLGTFGGARTEGVGINAHGDVAGYARNTDSTFQGLVWSADGTISKVPGGRPVPVGITDDGAVYTGNGGDYNGFGTYWRSGSVIRSIFGIPERLTYNGLAAHCYYSAVPHTVCAITFPDGRESTVRGSRVLAVNDANTFWLYDNDFGQPPETYIVASDAPTDMTPSSSIWPELIPPHYVTPPFADTIPVEQTYPMRNAPSISAPRALDNRGSYLSQTLVVTTAGAYSIEAQIADRSWHLVRAITMNEAGQILAIGYNTSTGAKSPIVLSPSRATVATSLATPQTAGAAASRRATATRASAPPPAPAAQTTAAFLPRAALARAPARAGLRRTTPRTPTGRRADSATSPRRTARRASR